MLYLAAAVTGRQASGSRQVVGKSVACCIPESGWSCHRVLYRMNGRCSRSKPPSFRAFSTVSSFDVRHHSGRILGKTSTDLFVDVWVGTPTLFRSKLDENLLQYVAL